MRLCSTRVAGSAIVQRGLCTASTSAPQPPQARKPRGRNDTEYVQRRYGWREALREERLSFLRGEGIGAGAGGDLARRELEKEMRRPKKDPAVTAARVARRLERQQRHLDKLEAVQVKKSVRQEAKRQIWEYKQEENTRIKAEELAAIEAVAHTWVNDANLDDNVDRCVDAFFIADVTTEEPANRKYQSYFELNK